MNVALNGKNKVLVLALVFVAWAGYPGNAKADGPYPWLDGPPAATLAQRFPPPPGFTRVETAAGSFGAWLRGLPLREGRGVVNLCTGRQKPNQDAHAAVLDIDTGTRDLQQCADAVIRLRAEYLFGNGCEKEIRFHFTSGDLAAWSEYRAGMRPAIRGNKVTWSRRAAPDSSYENFRRYLDLVFTYAGTASLRPELDAVADREKIAPGDVFVQPWGHAALVLDVAENVSGKRVFLLAQSYMPAQDIHVLKNPGERSNPWYTVEPDGPLVTPEWTFAYHHLRRFPAVRCGR